MLVKLLENHSSDNNRDDNDMIKMMVVMIRLISKNFKYINLKRIKLSLKYILNIKIL